MNAKTTKDRFPKAWVLYDGDCGLCRNLARRCTKSLARRRFELLPLQTPSVRERLGLDEFELLSEMRVLLPDGRIFGGAEAVVEISRRYGWARPLPWLARIPWFRAGLRAGYRWVARHRGCANGVCATRPPASGTKLRFPDLLPLLILPASALLFRSQFAPWVFMWVMSVSLYAGCKWLTYRIAVRNRDLTEGRRAAAYLFAWPGMDAARFLGNKDVPARPRPVEWRLATLKTVVGAVLIWGVARTAGPAHPLVTGWLGMIGVVFLLHFGWFHILSLFWRSRGMAATPLMRNPVMADSTAEFWGARWNTAFHELVVRFVFRPLTTITTPAAATLLVFLWSGLVHELVISLPANGGYGRPTAYFAIQALAILWERNRRAGVGRRIRRRIFTLIAVAGPVPLLFHPPFIHHVILPMLHAIGATGD